MRKISFPWQKHRREIRSYPALFIGRHIYGNGNKIILAKYTRLLCSFMIPSRDTPSVVAKQSFDREFIEYSLPKYLQIICKQAMPHCIVSC